MSGFNWARLRKEKPHGFKRWVKGQKSSDLSWVIYKEKNRDKMDKALENFGWQKCPRCGKGRHPYFKLCKKCRQNE